MRIALGAVPSGPCPSGVFLTFEQGVLAAVTWEQRQGAHLHLESIVTQSMLMEADVELGADQSTLSTSGTLTVAGSPPGPPKVRRLDGKFSYWSDRMPSSIEQAILRARVTGQSSVSVPIASPYSEYASAVQVEKLDERSWKLTYRDRQYDVVTDENGCMSAASLSAYGVVIEKRPSFERGAYPLFAPYAAPPGGAYTASDVSIPAPEGHVLAGTLTVPRRPPAACPAAVLITGLSPHERNNGTPPWMPFRDLADALTRAGFCVLRVDDRGVAASTGDRAASTTFDEANDVRTEVAWLRKRPDIDGTRVFLVGYSEGGLIAPMVAASDPGIAGVITLAGPGVPGPVLARYQIEAGVNGDPRVPPLLRKAEVERQLQEPLTPREKSFLGIDPLQVARGVRCPALILQGGTDLTVPPRSAELLAAAMRAGGNVDVTVRLFPGVSHSLLPDPVGLGSGWVFLPAFLTAPEILSTLVQWATGHLHP